MLLSQDKTQLKENVSNNNYHCSTSRSNPGTHWLCGCKSPWSPATLVLEWQTSCDVLFQVFPMLCISLSHDPAMTIQMVTERCCFFPEQPAQQASQCGQSPSSQRYVFLQQSQLYEDAWRLH